MRQPIELPDAAATEAFGARLARARLPDDELTVVCLTGDLGAGKTTLARGFLRACGVSGVIRSPTYTLVEIHETASLTLVHLDLYRLTEPEELGNLGLREWARPKCLWLIEWPGRAPGLLPPADLTLQLTATTVNHRLQADVLTDRGGHWLARLTKDIELERDSP